MSFSSRFLNEIKLRSESHIFKKKNLADKALIHIHSLISNVGARRLLYCYHTDTEPIANLMKHAGSCEGQLITVVQTQQRNLENTACSFSYHLALFYWLLLGKMEAVYLLPPQLEGF